MIELLQDLDAAEFSWSYDTLHRGEVLLIDVGSLPEAAAAEREILEAQGILTLLLVPVGGPGEMRGFVGFDAVGEPRDWAGDPVSVLRWFAHLLDATLGRLADRRARRAAEEQLRRLADQSSAAIFLYDAAVTHGLYANPAFERLLGVDRDDWTLDWRHAVATALSAADLAALDWVVDEIRADRWRELLDEQGCIFRGEQQVGAGDRWVFTSVFPILDADGSLYGFGAVSEDTTDRKRLEADLVAAVDRAETANAAKSRFLSRVSHELLNPLHALAGFTELLGGVPDLPPQAASFIGHVDHAGRRLSATVRDLLDLSRIEGGEAAGDPRPGRRRRCGA
jgi:signal transduction histidine kinase